MDLPKLTTQETANLNAATGLVAGLGQAMAQEAAGIYQQTAYQLNALNTLTVSKIRADQEERYAAIQAGRLMKRAELESMNYTMAGNTILRNMEKANATARARAAAITKDRRSGSRSAEWEEAIIPSVGRRQFIYS